MTHFEANGKDYLIWAEKPGTSDLRMAEIDPADPTQLTSTSILLSTPNYWWERDAGPVINEGPAVIKSDDEVFVFFSASEVNETYAVGMLRAPIGGDLMKPGDVDEDRLPAAHVGGLRRKAGGTRPQLVHARRERQPGDRLPRPPAASSEWIPGADGGLDDPSRHARVKTVHFAEDGSAVLNQTREEELARRTARSR